MYLVNTDDDPLLGLPLALGLLLSALVHLAIFAVFFSRPEVIHEQPFVANVTIDLPPPLSDAGRSLPRDLSPKANQDAKPPEQPMPLKNQIVTSPDNPNQAKANPAKRVFESDRNASTEHEQVKRGDAKDAGVPGPGSESVSEPAASQKAAAQKKVVPAAVNPAEKHSGKDAKGVRGASPPADPDAFSLSSNKPLQHLKLDDSTVLEKFALNAKPQPSLKERLGGQDQTGDFSTYQPFSRPAGSGARFHGKSGVTDYLPNLPDGDITLLNTKANKFATFVSRVATQVFAQMRARGLEGLSSPEILKASEANLVRVRLSPKGELLDMSVEKGSGSTRFDEVLTSSARLGAKDPNPPGDAVASDGTIHFIFQSQIWGQVMSDPRTGQIERRVWLLLATGLE